MANVRTARKHYALDPTKIKRAQKLLGAPTEVEAIEQALDEVISERERNRQVWKATERLLKSGVQIEDVFGRLPNNPED
jgi:hypothetical protein